ncbi:MAG TPA: FMN-binding protein [Flavobacteriaceae bacterium]|nr:FMN-binding protein [Flavobacteriaceae bacterium]
MSFALHNDLNKTIDKEIKETYDIENYSYSIKQIPQEMIEELPAKFDDNNLLEIKAENQLMGYAYISKAPSKTDEFDYLILLDQNLTVLKAKVLVYREDYGGEIGSKRWLKQFIGKTQDDELKYRENIVAISGATISVRSMTNAVNDLLQSLKILHSKHIL